MSYVLCSISLSKMLKTEKAAHPLQAIRASFPLEREDEMEE
jgi:hypothetical protein